MKKGLLLLILAALLCAPYGAQASAYTLTYGNGPAHIILFSDYFCPPCQVLEEGIDDALAELIKSGHFKVTYIPVPTTRLSLGVTIHLLSNTIGRPYTQVLPMRKTLYAKAKASKITAAEVNQWVTAAKNGKNMQEIAANVKTIQDTINYYEIKSTPTCVVIGPNGQAVKYEGVMEVGTAISDIIMRAQR